MGPGNGRRMRLGFMCATMAALWAARCCAQESGTQQITQQITQQGANAELLKTVQELAAQVKALNAKLDAVTTEQAKSSEEMSRLRQQLNAANARLAGLESPAKAEPGPVEASIKPAAAPSTENIPMQQVGGAPEKPSLEERLNRIEENQEFLDQKIADQSQAKVESGSKYRVRFSGIFLLNLYGNHGSVDNQDFPSLATEPDGVQSYSSFGGSLRQSQIGIEGFGPDLFGAHTSARIRFDFAGNATGAENGALMGNVRLRTGTFRMDWKDTSIVAGQDALFFAPLMPTSLSSLATPALSYAGNLWGWTPQVRIEHRFALGEASALKLSGGLMAPLSGDVPEIEQERAAARGEQSGIPAFATHVAWERKTASGTWSIGAGGYYGRQNWGFERTVDSWTSTVDLQAPLGRYFELSGEFYRGRAVGGLGGGVGQSVVATGPVSDPASSVHGLNSEGGWTQLKWKPRANFQVNGAYGQDDPFTSQLRFFPVAPSEYGEALTRTRSWFTNFIYEPKSNVVLSFEYKRLNTFDVGSEGYATDHLNLSLGYIF